jgi:hypothetical protein
MIEITNKEFLQAIFKQSFPTLVYTTNNYFNYKHISKLSPDEPQYYSVSTVSDHSRKHNNFLSMNIIVCDDVNTKAKEPTLPPSYIIETSHENYQYGYILDTPITDRKLAKEITNLLQSSIYSDPHGNNITRLVRLPNGINGKIDDPQKTDFALNLIAWDPTNTYTYAELTSLLTSAASSSPPPYANTYTDYKPYEIPTILPEGQRNTGMTRLCGYLFSQSEASYANVVKAMLKYNYEVCKPPLSVHDIETITNSIYQTRQSKFNSIIDKIYHIRTTNSWYDFTSHIEVSSDSLNTTHLKEFPGGRGRLPLLTKWLPKQPNYNQVDDVTWSPVPHGQQLRTLKLGNKLLLNTWGGFSINPKEGTVEPWLNHLSFLIPEPDYRRALLWWIAFTIQRPHLKASWQPIILGISGAGKDALFRPIATILGTAFKSIGNKDIKGDYDDGLYQTKLLHISEAHGLRGQAIEFYKRITALESSTIQMLNIKCKGKVFQQNICNVLVITNNLDAMRFDKTERRAFVLKAPEVMSSEQIKAYFDDWLDKGGAESLFHYLLNYDLSEFKPSLCPYRTTYFDELFDITKSDEESMLEELVQGFNIMLPTYLQDMLHNEIRFTGLKQNRTHILVWLQNNGWVRWDGGQSSKRIRRTIDGVQSAPKSRDWYVKKNSVFYNSKAADMHREVERVEAIFINKSKSKF